MFAAGGLCPGGSECPATASCLAMCIIIPEFFCPFKNANYRNKIGNEPLTKSHLDILKILRVSDNKNVAFRLITLDIILLC